MTIRLLRNYDRYKAGDVIDTDKPRLVQWLIENKWAEMVEREKIEPLPVKLPEKVETKRTPRKVK